MPDTINVVPGSGVTAVPVATEELPDDSHAQLIKLLGGAVGSVERIGGTSANGLQTDVVRSALPTGAATQATLQAVVDALTAVAAALQGTLVVSGPLDEEQEPTSVPVAVTAFPEDAANGYVALPQIAASVDALFTTFQFLTNTPAAGNASSVPAETDAVTLLPFNGVRRGTTITNDSTSVCYVALGETVSPTDFTVKLQPGDYYEIPFNYRGSITAVWETATGAARIWEGFIVP